MVLRPKTHIFLESVYTHLWPSRTSARALRRTWRRPEIQRLRRPDPDQLFLRRGLKRELRDVRSDLVAHVAGQATARRAAPSRFPSRCGRSSRNYRRHPRRFERLPRTGRGDRKRGDLMISQRNGRSPQLPFCCNCGHSAILPHANLLPMRAAPAARVA